MFGGFGLGGNSKKPSNESENSSSNTSNDSSVSKSSGSANNLSVHGFDPDALERAAKAARELDSSKNSQSAIRIIQEQEITKQKQSDMERARYLAMQEQLAIQRITESEKVAYRTLEEQTRHERSRLEYKDQLDRKRIVDQMNAQRHLNDEERSKTEESLRKQEEIRKRTLDHESELRERVEQSKIKAEYRGRIQQERENHDLVLEKRLLELKESRETILESVRLGTEMVGSGLKEYITDKEKLYNTALTLSVIALGIYSAKTSTGVVGRFIESRLGRPSLVRETSRTNILNIAKSPYSSLKTYLFKSKELSLKNVILTESLEHRLTRIAKTTSMTKANGSFYRNLLLAGPPGTGKTLYAKTLARQSGMHYAIMTGGDVTPLGKDGVTEIHKLFDWGNSSNKGLLLFIDEADAFLRKRSTEKLSEDLRNALNGFLYRTGESSKKIMLVYASNQPEQLDWAVNDRIDEIVTFQVPHYPERLRMIQLYMNTYLSHPTDGSQAISTTEVENDTALIGRIACETEGFSGREISKLVIAWQAAVYGSGARVLRPEIILEVLSESKLSKTKKLSWLNKSEVDHLTADAADSVSV